MIQLPTCLKNLYDLQNLDPCNLPSVSHSWVLALPLTSSFGSCLGSQSPTNPPCQGDFFPPCSCSETCWGLYKHSVTSGEQEQLHSWDPVLFSALITYQKSHLRQGDPDYSLCCLHHVRPTSPMQLWITAMRYSAVHQRVLQAFWFELHHFAWKEELQIAILPFPCCIILIQVLDI